MSAQLPHDHLHRVVACGPKAAWPYKVMRGRKVIRFYWTEAEAERAMSVLTAAAIKDDPSLAPPSPPPAEYIEPTTGDSDGHGGGAKTASTKAPKPKRVMGPLFRSRRFYIFEDGTNSIVQVWRCKSDNKRGNDMPHTRDEYALVWASTFEVLCNVDHQPFQLGRTDAVDLARRIFEAHKNVLTPPIDSIVHYENEHYEVHFMPRSHYPFLIFDPNIAGGTYLQEGGKSTKPKGFGLLHEAKKYADQLAKAYEPPSVHMSRALAEAFRIRDEQFDAMEAARLANPQEPEPEEDEKPNPNGRSLQGMLKPGQFYLTQTEGLRLWREQNPRLSVSEGRAIWKANRGPVSGKPIPGVVYPKLSRRRRGKLIDRYEEDGADEDSDFLDDTDGGDENV